MNWKNISNLINERKPSEYNTKIRDDFLKKMNMDRYASYSKPKSLKRLLNGDGSYNSGNKYDVPIWLPNNWQDHLEIYKQYGTSRIVLVSQPYQEPLEISQSLLNVVQPLGLRAVVFNKNNSWYYPDNTCLVLIMSKNTFEDSKEMLASIDSYYENFVDCLYAGPNHYLESVHGYSLGDF